MWLQEEYASSLYTHFIPWFHQCPINFLIHLLSWYILEAIFFNSNSKQFVLLYLMLEWSDSFWNKFSKAKLRIKNWWFCWLVCWWQYLRIECFMRRYNILAIIFHAMPPREKFIDIPRWISLGSCHHCTLVRDMFSASSFCHIIQKILSRSSFI